MMIRKLFIALLLVTLTSPALAYNKMPGKGITVKPARANWSTAYFHETIVRKGLAALGYTVKKPKELAVPLFYKSVTLGDIDYWPNGWFPLQDSYIETGKGKISMVGYVLKQQGLQGYVVDKKHAESLKITSLDDFKRPEVRKAFDKDGDGKADLTGAPHGWSVVNTINKHIKEYGLENDVKQVSASYEAAMAANVGAAKNGEPIFYYTWTPSWTVFKLKPGRDVVWINVPYNIAPSGTEKELKHMTISNLQGAVSNPLKMGFVVADIRAVANDAFLEKNPAAKKFLEVFTMKLDDLNAQYAKMMDGEKSKRDINRHADEWIAANKAQWENWLEQARQAAD